VVRSRSRGNKGSCPKRETEFPPGILIEWVYVRVITQVSEIQFLLTVRTVLLQSDHEHTAVSRAGYVHLTAPLCSERGAEIHPLFSLVRCETLIADVLVDDTEHPNFLCSFTLDEVSRFDRDTESALATVREWKNSFVRINRIPVEILSLIPTYLSSHRDLLRACCVCRHWRRTFLHCAELWSQLFLSEGEAYIKTFLERVKGSALDITVGLPMIPANTMTLLSSYTKQIKCLGFITSHWDDVLVFTEVHLPLLHTLKMIYTEEGRVGNHDTTIPLPRLFAHAVNVKVFHLEFGSWLTPPFGHYIFPNLVSFNLSMRIWDGVFRALDLLDFLESSPMLRTVDMEVDAVISLERIPRGRVVVLPSVETFNLTVNHGGPGWKIAAHVSCPSARSASFLHKKAIGHAIPEEIFPASVSWNAIARQYTRSPAEEITLKIRTSPTIACKLTFRSADATIIQLCFKVADEDKHRVALPSIEMHNEVFTQATRTIRSHPQLSSVKRLHIRHSFGSVNSTDTSHIADEARQLFKSLAPLDELTIHHCNLQPYFDSFLLERRFEEPIVFPPIKELTISYPLWASDEQCTAMVVGLAKSQHARGMPLQRVTIRRVRMFAGMEEGLKPWVGSVEHRTDPGQGLSISQLVFA
jgi:hypothetical protein